MGRRERITPMNDGSVPARRTRTGPKGHRSLDPADQRRAMDPVRQMVATSIHHHMLTADRPRLMGLPEGVISVTGTAVSGDITEIRVDTDSGPRFFLIKLQETPSSHVPVAQPPA